MNTKAKNIRYPVQNTTPIWAGDGLTNYTQMPNGTILEETDFIPYEVTDPGGHKRLYVPSGTLVGRSEAERNAGTGFGIADPATDDEMYLIVYDAYDLRDNNLVQLYRPTKLVFYNHLPQTLLDGSPLIPSPSYTAIRDIYTCWFGSD